VALLLLATLASITSYEAAIMLPLVLVLGDIMLLRTAEWPGGANPMRVQRLGTWLALLGTLPIYGAIATLGAGAAAAEDAAASDVDAGDTAVSVDVDAAGVPAHGFGLVAWAGASPLRRIDPPVLTRTDPPVG
jgi:hypothetical protein